MWSRCQRLRLLTEEQYRELVGEGADRLRKAVGNVSQVLPLYSGMSDEDEDELEALFATVKAALKTYHMAFVNAGKLDASGGLRLYHAKEGEAGVWNPEAMADAADKTRRDGLYEPGDARLDKEAREWSELSYKDQRADLQTRFRALMAGALPDPVSPTLTGPRRADALRVCTNAVYERLSVNLHGEFMSLFPEVQGMLRNVLPEDNTAEYVTFATSRKADELAALMDVPWCAIATR